MSPKNSQARIDANNRYNEKVYDRINIAIPKGRKLTVEAYAKSRGESINGLVNLLLREEMDMTESEWRGVDMEEMESKNRETVLRRKAQEAGYAIHKSRKAISPDNLGGYMIVDTSINAVVAGSNYELDLDAVEELLNSIEE